ncbi:MAG: RsmD family RNA methyltransferase [Puniceicoccales bacterium]|jgi:16S rRNA (guanine966-N2)-methyltransferase|nr:RsmD family RNA methyltransferase [Puniceicoccales bacterium]
MRITGGLARGIPLKLPARGEIRPSTGYLREAVFSSIGANVIGATVLDLFAGTGAYGLEALSRGAQNVCFIEKGTAAIHAIRTNAAAVSKALASSRQAATDTSITILKEDALRWIPTSTFTLIFCDPPWALWQNEALPLLAKLPQWTDGPDAHLVIECPCGRTPPLPPDKWHIHRHLAKGKNQPSAFILKPKQ